MERQRRQEKRPPWDRSVRSTVRRSVSPKHRIANVRKGDELVSDSSDDESIYSSPARHQLQQTHEKSPASKLRELADCLVDSVNDSGAVEPMDVSPEPNDRGAAGVSPQKKSAHAIFSVLNDSLNRSVSKSFRAVLLHSGKRRKDGMKLARQMAGIVGLQTVLGRIVREGFQNFFSQISLRPRRETIGRLRTLMGLQALTAVVDRQEQRMTFGIWAQLMRRRNRRDRSPRPELSG